MKKRSVLTLMAMAVLLAASCGPGATPAAPPPAKTEAAAKAASSAQAWEVEWNKTVAGAKKEGKITVATSAGPETREALARAFSAKYGIDVDFVIGTAAEVLPKIQAERRAGLYTTDAMINGTSSLIMFKKQGLFDPLEPALVLPDVKDPRTWFNDTLPYFDKDRTGIGFLSQYNSCVLRNTEMVKEGEITSYVDLLKPQWKEKVVMIDPSIPGSGNAFFATLSFGVWDVDRASQWLRQMLKEQKMTLTRDSRLQLEWVARGKYPIGVGVNTDPLVNFVAQGAPVAQQKVKEGGFVTTSIGGVGLLNKPAHPDAAVVFVNWLLSREGQIAFTSGFGGPSSRKDVKVEGAYAILTPMPGEKAYIEDEEGIAKKVELQKATAQIIAETAR